MHSYHPPTFGEKYGNQKTKWQMIRDFDFIGLILFTGGLLIFLMGLSWGGSLYPWKSGHVIGTIVVGFLALIAFVLYETFMSLKEPFVPIHLFQNGPWVADVLVVALGASIYYAFAIVWPQMVFTLYTSDLTHGGFMCCVTGSAINIGQILGGTFSRQVGKQKVQLIVTAICTGAFLGGKDSFHSLPNTGLTSKFSICLCHTIQSKRCYRSPLPGLFLGRLARIRWSRYNWN
jgi:ATP/ADP translocase